MHKSNISRKSLITLFAIVTIIFALTACSTGTPAEIDSAELDAAQAAAANAQATADAALAALEAAAQGDEDAQAELAAQLDAAQAALESAQTEADEAMAAAEAAKAEAAAAEEEMAEEVEPILIGFTSDASGQYANSGAMDRRGMMMAIKEFNDNGGVLGRPIEFIHYDTETTPATGTRITERMINQDNVSFLIGAVSSGVANAISQVAQENGVIYFNTNSSSPSESAENCHRTKFVWDGHGANFSNATVGGAVESFGDQWVLLTNDYVWGHETSAATRAQAEAAGATIVDEILVPQGTRDFSSILLTLQQLDPDVVAAAVGGDDLKAMRIQVVEQGMDQDVAWINNQQDWPDVYGVPPFGLFGTTWYYGLDLPGVDEFVAAYQEAYPESSLQVPGNVYYNGYMAMKTLLQAIEQAGTTNNHEIIKLLEGWEWTAEERMQDYGAWIDPETHHVEQTVYLGTANNDPSEEYDIYKIVTTISPENALAKGTCVLESFEDTPVYEP